MVCCECGDNIYGPFYVMKITEPFFEGEYKGQEVYFHKKCAERVLEVVE